MWIFERSIEFCVAKSRWVDGTPEYSFHICGLQDGLAFQGLIGRGFCVSTCMRKQKRKTSRSEDAHSVKQILHVLESWNVPRLIPVACIAVMLINTFRLYKNAYFWLDDFNNLYWVQRATLGQMMGYIVNPVSSYFRPVGMLCYWLLLQFSGLHPAPYHWVAWSIHTANTALVYLILWRLTKARSGAAVGAMLFATEAVYAQIYGDFGTIFELLAGFFCFVGILLWVSERRDWWQVILASLALLLAMKAKEVAVALALAFVIYDLLLWGNCVRTLAGQWLLPCGLSLWYGLTKAAAMRGIATTDAYYMTVNGSTLVAGFTTYGNMLLGTKFPWQAWGILVTALLLICVLLRNRLALFFLSWIFITFLPVIFLVNHRFAFYWYLPFFGVSGLAAIVAKHVADMIEKRNPTWLAAAGGYCVFALLCFGTFIWHRDATRPHRARVRQWAQEYRCFVTGLEALPSPSRREVLYFDSKPSHFNQTHLLSATQVALRRTDVGAELVSEFPSDARYRLRFEGTRLIQVPPDKNDQQ